MEEFNRRDFLKLMAAIPTGMVLSKILAHNKRANPSGHNVIILVLDALSARNMSLYGYPRETTPNMERFAARSNVYHAHHSAATFTSAGVASLLTGTYPWTHRAINLWGLVARDRYERNIYKLLEADYKGVAYTQNRHANYVLCQFSESIEQHIPIKAFSQLELYLADVGDKDNLFKFRALDDFLYSMSDSQGSLLLGTLNRYRKVNSFHKVLNDELQYNGTELIFDINHVFNGLAAEVSNLEPASFCYYHLMPPHDPFLPKKKFRRLFHDNWKPLAKPRHALRATLTNEELNDKRLNYDQYLANADSAFGRFINEIERAGILDNSYLILTSDHGESFERGYLGHAGPFTYEPGIHIPLIISSPGQTTRRDFHSVTNSIDILPTLLSLAGIETPTWGEGEILPGFGSEEDPTRVTFSMEAKHSSSFGELSPITIAMYQGDHKLIYYKGYPGEDSPYFEGLFEMYNLKNDPEEMQDLINEESRKANEMKEIMLGAYRRANEAMKQTN